jgi:hypothetical protein
MVRSPRLRHRALESGIASPLRNTDQPDGIRDSSGALPQVVQKANLVAVNTLKIVEAVAKRGGSFVIENPPYRGIGSPFAIKGRESHASLWQFTPMQSFAERHGSHFVYFDQGAAGAPTRKTTALLCSADMHPSIAKRFGPLMSPSSTNDAELYGEPVDGVFRSAPSALFPPQVNRLLAESFLERRQPSTSFMTKIALTTCRKGWSRVRQCKADARRTIRAVRAESDR